MSKILFCFVLLIASLEVFAQQCVYEFTNPDTDPIFCLKDGRSSGDYVSMSCADFSDADLIDQFIEMPGEWCDLNARIKVVRRFKEEEIKSVSRSSLTSCVRVIEFGGTNFEKTTGPDAPCRQILTLNIQIDENSTVNITPAPSATIPCNYDLVNDPVGLIGEPSSDSGGTFSFVDDKDANNCEGTTTIQRTWIWTSCCGSSSNAHHTQQSITVMPANCSASGDFSIDRAMIPTGSYYAPGILSSAGTIDFSFAYIDYLGPEPEPTNVQFYATDEIILNPGFHVSEGAEFLAKIAPCNTQPVNDICAYLPSLTCGETITGSTSNSTHAGVDNFDSYCDIRQDILNTNLNKGVFFNYRGTGTRVKISTDNPLTNFDTELRLYTGDCTSNRCIMGNDDIVPNTNPQSTLEFYAKKDTNYIIYLDGYSTTTGVNGTSGNYEISVSCSIPVEAESLSCGSDITSNNFDKRWEGDVSCVDDFDEVFYPHYIANFHYLTVEATMEYGFTLNTTHADPRRQGIAVFRLNDDYSYNYCEWYNGTGFDYTVYVTLTPGIYLVAVHTDDNWQEPRHCYDLSISCTTLLLPTESTIELSNTLPKESTTTPKHKALTNVNWQVSVYPNPSNGQATISYHLPVDKPVKITLFDTMGHALQVAEKKGSSQHLLDYQSYPPGIYFVQVETGDFKTRKKIILAK